MVRDQQKLSPDGEHPGKFGWDSFAAEMPGRRSDAAGGVKALQALFEALPDGLNAAFVVIVHLDPNQQSELASILAGRTPMPVAQVSDSMELEPNHVYVIPPNRRLVLSDREIATAEFGEPRGRRLPIDQFFRSSTPPSRAPRRFSPWTRATSTPASSSRPR